MIYCASKFPTQRLADMLTNNKGRLKLAAREPIYQLVIREHEHSLYKYTVSPKKHVTTFSTITLTISVQLQ